MDIQPLTAEAKIALAGIIFAAAPTYALASLLRRWYTFRGSEQWPIAEATVEAAEVHSFKGNYFVKIGYSYQLNSSFMTGWGERSFSGEDEADTFATSIRGQKVTIRFNPKYPERSRID